MLSAAISVILVAAAGGTTGLEEPQGLSKAETAAGWKLYSGADAAKLWRGYNQKEFPTKGWEIKDGVMTVVRGGGGGDIVTNDEFGDVEMSFKFKLGPKANSGVMWRVAETNQASYMTGPEFQLLEDATYGVKPTDAHACGALYDLYPPAEGKTMKPAGEWNEGRIWLRNGVIQHWVNGKKVVDAKIYSDKGAPTTEWTEKILASKFKDAKGFGVMPKGHIAVQEHGDTELSLTDIRIRDLSAHPAGEVPLFDGKSLHGWTPFLPDVAGKPHVDQYAAWTVEDGAIQCKGQPIGYIRTEKDYKNFVLKLEWRFDAKKGAGNSGVLLRMVGEDKVWPKSVEAQLESGNAGDFWNIDSVKMTVDKARTNGRNTKKTHGGVERPIGEWNEYEIICDGGTVILKVNGEEMNRATDVEVVPGKICLQSEGAAIQFRNIRLVPLD